MDVLAGKFNMDVEKYINLAAYGLHVENSDFDSNIHTIEYLKTLKLLPEVLFLYLYCFSCFLMTKIYFLCRIYVGTLKC